MGPDSVTGCTAFAGHRQIASGPVAEVARAVREALDADPALSVLVFDDATANQVELDLRGTPDEVAARHEVPPAAPRGPGRPKLGVVAREVTLLPRHWEWLASQPGGASVTLRKLVEEARKANADSDAARVARDAAYRFMLAACGNLPEFEEVTRALYAGDHARFNGLTDAWPADVRDYALCLASDGLE